MGKKLSVALIILGCLLMVMGLGLLASGMTQKHDESIGGTGIMAFAFGALTCASGMYMKARAAQAALDAVKPAPKTRGGCDLCGTESPAVMCRAHQVHLCATCLQKHYDSRSCIYVPSTRRAPAARAAWA